MRHRSSQSWTTLLAALVLAVFLTVPSIALADDVEAAETNQTQPTASYPAAVPPTAAGMIQQGAYIPGEGERALSTEDLTGAVTFVSEAVIKLSPPRDELLSMDYVNVDVRAVVARIAKLAGRHVLFFGEPAKVSVKCNIVTPMKALEETLNAAEGMKYLLDGDVIVVGPEDLLTNTFLYADVVATRPLNVLTVPMLENLCKQLNLPYVLMEAVDDRVRLVAPPHDLAHILMLLESLDAPENFLNPESDAPDLILEQLTLSHITGRQLVTLAEQFGIRKGLYYDINDDHRVYLTGPDGNIADLRAIATAFDVPLNREVTDKTVNVQAQPYQLTAQDPLRLERMLEGCGIAFRILTMSDRRNTVYAIGEPSETRQAVAMLQKLDQEENLVLTILDSASTTRAMTTLRDTIAQETSLSASDFAVTNNLGGAGPLYYLYAVSTPEEAAELGPWQKVSVG